MAKRNSSRYIVEDGIIIWYRGASFMEEAEEVLTDASQDILNYAKDNAPWTDQTGQAREGLGVEISQGFGAVTLDLYHTVDYGLWLEVIQNARFATILPTLEHYAPQVFAEMANTVEADHQGRNYRL